MNVQVFCPKCDRSCRIKQELLGRRVRCPGCDEIFRAEEVPVAEADPEPQDIPPPHLEEFFPEHPSTRVPKLDKKPAESNDVRAVTPLVKPGNVSNPFSEEAALAGAAPVDTSLFEFEYGDDPPATAIEPNRPEKPPHSVRADAQLKPPVKRSIPADQESNFNFDDTDEKPLAEGPPKPTRSRMEAEDRTPEKPVRGLAKKKTVPVEDAQAKSPVSDSGSPFHFGDSEEPPVEARHKRPTNRREPEVRRAEPDEHRPAKKQAAPKDDSADFLGLRDEEPVDDQIGEPKPKATSGKRKFFHVRQSGFWSEVRLFRVFLHDGGLVFVSAASGKDVAEAEEAIETGSMKNCEKRIRNRLIDLDELSVEELSENDRNGFRSTAEKIIEASIDAPPRSLLRKHGSAILRLEHKSKGVMQFELLHDDDVDRAIDYLPDLLDEVLEIKVRWDKSKKCYVAR